MINQPLFLPKGSIRAIIILTLTLAILSLIASEKNVPEIIITIWAGAIGWYFGGKVDSIKYRKNE